MSLKIIHTKNLKWVDIVNPDEADLSYLKENFKFHPLDFDDIITPAIRVKIDEYADYHFIILLFPIFNRELGEIKPAEVDFFVGKNFVVTIHDGSMKTLTNLVHNVHQYDNIRGQYMNDGPGSLLFQLLELLFKRSSPILDKLNHDINDAGKHVFELEMPTLQRLSQLKKNIIIYRRVMKMHHYVLNKLANSTRDYLKFKDSKTYFMNLIEYAENIWDVLTADKESVESFEDSNQTLGTHRINDILQILTVFSVIVATLTLITDIFIFFERTNIEKTFGIASDFQLTAIVASTLLIVSLSMLYLFRRNKWL